MLNSPRMLAQCSIFEKFANFPEHAFIFKECAVFHLYSGNVWARRTCRFSFIFGECAGLVTE